MNNTRISIIVTTYVFDILGVYRGDAETISQALFVFAGMVVQVNTRAFEQLSLRMDSSSSTSSFLPACFLNHSFPTYISASMPGVSGNKHGPTASSGCISSGSVPIDPANAIAITRLGKIKRILDASHPSYKAQQDSGTGC